MPVAWPWCVLSPTMQTFAILLITRSTQLSPSEMTIQTVNMPEELQSYWKQLDCGFPRVAEVFPDCLREAQALLSDEGLTAYIEHARFLGKMGRGAEPILIFLEEWPEVAKVAGEEVLSDIMGFVRKMWK